MIEPIITVSVYDGRTTYNLTGDRYRAIAELHRLIDALAQNTGPINYVEEIKPHVAHPDVSPGEWTRLDY